MNKVYIVGQLNNSSFFVNADITTTTSSGQGYFSQYYLKYKMHPIRETPERTRKYFTDRSEGSFIKLEFIYE